MKAKDLRILFLTIIMMIAGGCGLSTPSLASPIHLTPTSSSLSEGAASAQTENAVQSINTPDYANMTPPAADMNPFVRLAEEDLASRLSTSINQIHLLKISDIDWKDITQGCAPAPGQTLIKGRLSGYRIWLEANGKNYLYHIGLDNTIFLCPE